MLKNPLPNSKLEKWPKGNVRQWFGENIDLYMQAIGSQGHTGIDIATWEGDVVCAAHNGLIIEKYNATKGYGYHIRIVSEKQSNGTYLETIYGHLREDMPVNVGDQVKVGEPIGYQSNSGFVISGSSIYWGTAPGGIGTHLHFGVRLLTDPLPNTYQTSYAGGKYVYSVKNHNNGLFGYIDPMQFLETMKLKLVKEKDRNAVYAIIRGNYYWISPEAMIDLVGDGFADWKDVEVVDTPIQLDRVIK